MMLNKMYSRHLNIVAVRKNLKNKDLDLNNWNRFLIEKLEKELNINNLTGYVKYERVNEFGGVYYSLTEDKWLMDIKEMIHDKKNKGDKIVFKKITKFKLDECLSDENNMVYIARLYVKEKIFSMWFNKYLRHKGSHNIIISVPRNLIPKTSKHIVCSEFSKENHINYNI